MSSFDGAEICELTDLYLLSKFSVVIDSDNVGLYRDDGVAVIHNANGPKLNRLRKNIIATFKSEGLSITFEELFIREKSSQPGETSHLSEISAEWCISLCKGKSFI